MAFSTLHGYNWFKIPAAVPLVDFLLVANAPSQVPAILLGMLGVDERYQGMGLGAQLLRDAILNSLKVSELAGARALVVDPTGGGRIGFLSPLRVFRSVGHDAHGSATYNAHGSSAEECLRP